MSRLWTRPRLRAYLGESHLAVSEVQGLLRPRILRQIRLPVADGVALAAAELAEWRRAAAAPTARLPLRVVLGTAHVRYVVLPWDPRLVDPALRASLASALLQRQFQVEAVGYELRVGALAWGAPLLAAFVARGLLTALADGAAASGLKLDLIEPLLPVVLDRFARRLAAPGGAATFVLGEEGRALRVRLRHGAVASLELRPWRDRQDLEQLRTLDGGPAWAWAPSLHAGPIVAPDGWLALPPVAGFADAHADHVFALCAGS